MSEKRSQSAASSFVFKLLESFGNQGIAFVVSLVLGRLLTPDDYGVLSLLLVFTAIAQVFVQSGLNTALIQRADAGYIAILSDGDKAQLRVITGLCTVSLGHCDLRGADDAFGIHWPHTAFSPALQDVVTCKI